MIVVTPQCGKAKQVMPCQQGQTLQVRFIIYATLTELA